jgi:hypothetical protein
VEALVALALLGVAAGAAAITGAALQRNRAPAAARRAASDMRALRWDAVARARSAGLLLTKPAGHWDVALVDDGDGDGLRTDDIRRGVDRLRGPAQWTRDRWGVEPGFARGLTSLRSPPPDDEALRDLTDPVQFGSRDIVSCSPEGSMSPGTLYLTDGGRRQFAVVACGPTARIRVWEYLIASRRWVQR